MKQKQSDYVEGVQEENGLAGNEREWHLTNYVSRYSFDLQKSVNILHAQKNKMKSRMMRRKKNPNT